MESRRKRDEPDEVVQDVPSAGAEVARRAQGMMYRFACGFLDGCNLTQAWRLLHESSSLWHVTRNVLLFNGIWMGVVFMINSVVSRWAAALVHGYIDPWILEQFIVWTWLVPMYILSLVLSLLWYQDTTQACCILLDRRPRVPTDAMERWKRFLESAGDEIYRLVVLALFLVMAKVLQMIPACIGVPFIGTWLYFACCCWTASIYAFEYIWIYIGWTLDERLNFFETRWPYMAGFGAPLTIATFQLSLFSGAALYTTCFPFLIMAAAAATPRAHIEKTRMRMFWAPGHLASGVCMAGIALVKYRASRRAAGARATMAVKGSGQVAEAQPQVGRATGSKPVEPSAGGVDGFEEAKGGEAVDDVRSGLSDGGGGASSSCALHGGVEG